ncbi:ribosomal protein L4 [Hesseltinella vesiculosa]|uniref:Large ribosomal subunit protein uL4m n=1 Tax=Hesseltinella vesiculosa TaxID=101127 RepID=A0A1X2GUE8_9FUNG|nr:ribosomal protein L4 [Hesseltinella vesiculosa]
MSQRTFASIAKDSVPKVLAPTVQAFVRDFKTNEPLSITNLSSTVFAAPLRKDILHRVVVWQRDNMRQGTKSTKTRSEVAGTSKKQAPQKGRGKARVGDGKAPHMTGGGIAFGPKPRDFGTKLPRKVQDFGLRVALSTKYAQDQLSIVETFDSVDSLKTRDLAELLSEAHQHQDQTFLMIINSDNDRLQLAARNLPRCEVIYVEETNALDLLSYDKVFLEKSAVDILEAALTPQ